MAQAVCDSHRQEFVMSRAKVNFRRFMLAIDGLMRLKACAFALLPDI